MSLLDVGEISLSSNDSVASERDPVDGSSLIRKETPRKIGVVRKSVFFCSLVELSLEASQCVRDEISSCLHHRTIWFVTDILRVFKLAGR